PSAPFTAIDTAADLGRAVRDVGLPLVLKLRRQGYDGRGQRVVRRAEDIGTAWAALGEGPAIAERWIEFEREVSLIAVRGAAGELAFYPLAENTHRDGILHTTVAPYEDAALQRRAEG